MKAKLRLFLVLSMAIACVQFSYAQFTATGKITDETGEPLIGATVLVKGTSKGTVTDFDGTYSIEISGTEATLVFSYTGYTTVEFPVSAAQPTLSVEMESSAETLSEVIVVGYGEVRKEALTGAVSSLESEKIEQVPMASVEQNLQGNIAGLQSNMGNGQPGSSVQIRIRGQGSISASSEPLFVVDGVPIYNPGDALGNFSETANVMATMNPNDIESVTVLKDAAATSIYGARAANGVILITTKSGRTGKPSVKLSTQVGWNDWAVSEDKRLRGLTSQEYTELFMDGELNRGTSVEDAIERFNGFYPDPFSGQPAVDITPDGQGGYNIGEIRVDNRWLDEISRTGFNQSYNLSVSGGNESVTYFASAGYFDQEAPIIGVDFDRLSARVNVAAQVTDWLKISNNLNVTRSSQNGPDDATAWSNPMYNGLLLPPVIPAKDPQGRFYADHQNFMIGGNNPIGSLSGDDEISWQMDRIVDNLSAEITILEGLKFKSNWAVDLLNYGEIYFRNARYGDGRNSNGFASETTRRITNWVGTQTLNYDFSLNEAHNFNLLAGYEANKTERRNVIAQAEQFPPNNSLRTMNNAAAGDPGSSWYTGFSFESLFGRLSYNYKYKYYLQGSVRRDGSSRFGSENRYGTFWSIGASWRIDQEPFLQGSGVVNSLKLRSSYGTTGNAEIGDFDWQPLIGFGFDYIGQPGGAPTSVGNTFLTWEENTSFNIGLDFGLWNRLSGTIEYFDRESDNLLLDVPISRTTGFTSITDNFGAMRNSGVELTLNAILVNTGDFNWSIGGNISFIQNEITRLESPIVAGTHDRFRREVGREFNEYWMFDWAGVDPDNGRPLFYTDETRSQTTSSIGEAERFYIGKRGTPDFFGGFNTSLGWGGLTLDAQFTFTYDNWLYDATAWVIRGDGRFTPRSQSQLVLDRWRQPGDQTDVPQFIWGGNPGSNTQGSTRYLLDGTHVRLRNLTLAYQLPASLVSRAKLSSARVYVRGINLLTWTRDPDLYADPEAAINGFLESTVPNIKTISVGLDVGF